MNRTEFDKFADEYREVLAQSIETSGEAPEFFAEYKVRDVARLLRAAHPNGERLSVLDFGSGTGGSVPFFQKFLPEAEVTCVDVSLRSLEVGNGRFPSGVHFVAFDGGRLPFGDESFDCAFASCVFHHIPADSHVPLMAELKRVLKPAGTLVIFEHNPFNPLTVRTVRACPFDENAVLILATELRRRIRQAGFSRASIAYRVFFPRLLRALRPLEVGLTWLPVGAQYFVAARK